MKCAINPDAHRTEGLQDLWFGVTQARKGWLTRGDVVNCLPLGKIEKELQRKRVKMGVGVKEGGERRGKGRMTNDE